MMFVSEDVIKALDSTGGVAARVLESWETEIFQVLGVYGLVNCNAEAWKYPDGQPRHALVLGAQLVSETGQTILILGNGR